MHFHKLALLALMGGAACGGALANTNTSTIGSTTTYFENFNGGTDFNTDAWVNTLLSPDDYLWLTNGNSTASFSFQATEAIASLTLSFWYSALGAGNGAVSLASLLAPTLTANLGGTTSSPVFFAANNPGSGGSSADGQYSTTLTNLAAGDYTLNFSKIGGNLNSMKLDDVSVTVTAVPEPQTYALLLGGLGMVGWVARRRRPNRD